MKSWMTLIALVILAVWVSGCASVGAPNEYWALNKKISHRFTYVTDQEKHGVPQYVEAGVTGDSAFSGDCEEYSIAIQHQLAQRGIPSSRWIVKAKAGLHALTCSSDGWCFDAKLSPTRREQVPYIFITRT